MIALALTLGVLSALAHLQVLAWRARAFGDGRVGWALMLAPFGVVVPLAGLAAVLVVAPQASWAWILGLLAGRFLALGRFSREDRWTR